jgi:hypothetical protein
MAVMGSFENNQFKAENQQTKAYAKTYDYFL